MDWIKDLVRLLGDRGLASLRDLVPAIRIPVGIEKGLDLPGTSGGAVTMGRATSASAWAFVMNPSSTIRRST